MTRPLLAPSLLSADFARLGEEAVKAAEAGADLLHLDVMDGHYVPNLTVGPLVCEALRPHARVPIDVHLMVRPVDALVVDFAKAGAKAITFHPEASEHPDRTLSLIRDSGCRAGLALNPATPLEWLDWTMDRLDLVLVMSVNPGFGGQKFIPSALAKIREVRRRVRRSGRDIRVAVDGGIKVDNISDAARAGADMYIVGSAFFGTPDYAATARALREGMSPRRARDRHVPPAPEEAA